ncbi:hypothetical protein [Mucilaginibacter inviolabilis]|jgi:hypothetical protein|uniref:hypothetical protein n=1 Tax=Mucilaginibacter inviolabilis TaxID=2714892 RepID=UPI001F4885CB|nr:hypothetical protein [Mucilaginibacter inviolabilis]
MAIDTVQTAAVIYGYKQAQRRVIAAALHDAIQYGKNGISVGCKVDPCVQFYPVINGMQPITEAGSQSNLP